MNKKLIPITTLIAIYCIKLAPWLSALDLPGSFFDQIKKVELGCNQKNIDLPYYIDREIIESIVGVIMWEVKRGSHILAKIEEKKI